jgi:hypothetical protein
MMLAGDPVDIADALGLAGAIRVDLVDEGVGAEFQITGRHRRRQQHRRALEVGADRAAAVARRGVETRRAIAQRPGQDGRVHRRHRNAQGLEAAGDELLVGPRRRGRQQAAFR